MSGACAPARAISCSRDLASRCLSGNATIHAFEWLAALGGEASAAVPTTAARWRARITVLPGRPSWRWPSRRPGLSLPIPRWPGSSGWSHLPRADAGPLNPSALSPQCRQRRERGRVPTKIQRGCLASCPGGLWTPDAGLQSWPRPGPMDTRGGRLDPPTPRDPGSTCQLRVLGLRGERT